jgi:methyltransferase (TIGR00027 family)
MTSDGLSRMAELAALLRAAHLLFDRPPWILEDALAIRLLEPKQRVLLRFPGFFRFLQAVAPLRPARGQVVVRARYAEDRLAAAIDRGVRQYVILGAGLDSYAFRCARKARAVRIFEVDHPTTQAWKRAKIARAGCVEPANLTFVPIDLERQPVAAALAGAGYCRWTPTFFSWLGGTHYLAPETVVDSLRELRTVAHPASELVLDYGLGDESLSPERRATKRQVAEEAARRGEPMHSFFEPEELVAQARRAGWQIADHLTPDDERTRYLGGRTDGLDVLGIFALLALAGASTQAGSGAEPSV